MQEYHLPVLYNECLDGLAIRPDGVYIDATFGGGGHSAGILAQLGPEGKLLVFDQDADAAANAEKYKADKRFTFIASNFRNIKKFLRLQGITKVDGILADLGISSHQIDEPSRGFSTRFDGPLDMRMNKNIEQTAAHIVNTYSEADLHRLFGIYGEIKNAKTVANNICLARSAKKIETSQELKAILDKNAPRGKEYKYYAQVYQALRIEVNQELEALKELLEAAPSLLASTGRLCIISFHSLEDRLVKNYIKTGKFFGEVEKDMFGNEQRPLQSVTRKPITATEQELKANNRSRSAKLRIATIFG